jgi:hypothetical protein
VTGFSSVPTAAGCWWAINNGLCMVNYFTIDGGDIERHHLHALRSEASGVGQRRGPGARTTARPQRSR